MPLTLQEQPNSPFKGIAQSLRQAQDGSGFQSEHFLRQCPQPFGVNGRFLRL
jgi:hypothetical protein